MMDSNPITDAAREGCEAAVHAISKACDDAGLKNGESLFAQMYAIACLYHSAADAADEIESAAASKMWKLAVMAA